MSLDDGAAGIRPVDVAPAHAVVVRYLKRAIHLYEFPAGSKLPAERELAVQLGVSRATLREALRALEGANYIEVRRGSSGGVFVLDRTITPPELREWFAAQGTDIETLLNFRADVESFAATQAAPRANQALVDELTELNERMATTTNVGEFRQADQRFHMRIAEASGVELVRHTVEEVRAALFLPYKLLELSAMKKRSIPEHRRIIAALGKRSAGEAGRLMDRHIRGTAKVAGLSVQS